MEITPIAYIRSDFQEKFGIPRQSGLVEALRAEVVFAPEYGSTASSRTAERPRALGRKGARVAKTPKRRLPEALLAVLAQDPRPSYQEDPDRVYGMAFAEWQVRFTAGGGRLRVVDISK